MARLAVLSYTGSRQLFPSHFVVQKARSCIELSLLAFAALSSPSFFKGKLELKSDRSPFAERGAESAKARFAENQPFRAILLVQNLIEESSFSQSEGGNICLIAEDEKKSKTLTAGS